MYLCWSGILIRLAGAANEGRYKHVSTGRILEFSLRNLKESLQKTIVMIIAIETTTAG